MGGALHRSVAGGVGKPVVGEVGKSAAGGRSICWMASCRAWPRRPGRGRRGRRPGEQWDTILGVQWDMVE